MATVRENGFTSELGLPSHRKTARKIAAPWWPLEKTDLILCTESPNRERLPESANRSVARRAEQLAFIPHRAAATSVLTNSAFS